MNLTKKLCISIVVCFLSVVSIFATHPGTGIGAVGVHPVSGPVDVCVKEVAQAKSWRGRYMPCFLGGVSQQPKIPTRIQLQVKKKYWLTYSNPMDDQPIVGLTVADLTELAAHNCIPAVENMAKMSMKELAKALVIQGSYFTLKKWKTCLVKKWNKKDKIAQAYPWFNCMPVALQEDIKRYFRAAMVKWGLDFWLQGDTSIDLPITYFVEMGVVALPTMVANVDALARLTEAEQVHDYVRDVMAISANQALSEYQKKQQVAKLLASMPEHFKVLVAVDYAKTTDFKGSLLEEKTSIGSINWTVTLADLVADVNFVKRFNREISATGTLNLTGMHLSAITAQDFQELDSLNNVRTLIIRDNPLVEIHADAFMHLPVLTKVVINGTGVTTLPSDLFLHNQALDKICITNNKKLMVLPGDFFRGHEGRSLTLVDLSGNALTEDVLPFMGGMRIENLHLSCNKLSTLYATTVTQDTQRHVCQALAQSLHELWLDGNKVLSFENKGNALAATLHALPELLGLQLADNDFSSSALSIVASCQLPHLIYLSLAGNPRITQLYNGPIVPAPMMGMAPAVGAPVGVVGAVPGAMPPEILTLRALDMSRCCISSIRPGELRLVKNIKVLDLRSNGLKLFGDTTPNMGSAFSDARDLEELHLGDNSLESLTRESFRNLTNLKGLYLEGNCLIRVAKDSFKDLSELDTLIMFGNNHYFSWNPKASGKLLVLEPGVLNGLVNLKFADFSFNNIPYVTPGWLNGCLRLTMLSLGHNALHALVNDTFQGAPNLEEIDLAGNRITDIELHTFRGLTGNCRKVYFRGNNAFGLFSYFTSLRPYLVGGCAARFDKNWRHCFLFAGLTRLLQWANPRAYTPFMQSFNRRLADDVMCPTDFVGKDLVQFEEVYKARRVCYTCRVVNDNVKVVEET